MTSATVTLTDAQIKALPTTPIQILPTPAAGKIYLVISAVFYVDTRNGAYSNINSDFFCALVTDDWYDNVSHQLQARMFNRTTRSLAFSNYAELASPSSHGQVAFGEDYEDSYDQPINLYCDNLSDGDFTDGDASNSMKVTVHYIELTL